MMDGIDEKRQQSEYAFNSAFCDFEIFTFFFSFSFLADRRHRPTMKLENSLKICKTDAPLKEKKKRASMCCSTVLHSMQRNATSSKCRVLCFLTIFLLYRLVRGEDE